MQELRTVTRLVEVVVSPASDSADLLISLIQEAERGQRLAEAEVIASQTLLTAPKSVEARLLLATICGQTGRMPAAERYLREAIEIDPDCVPAICKLAQLLRFEGRAEEGRILCKEALARHPDHPELLMTLGQCKFAMSAFAAAEGSFRRVTELQPTNSVARFLLGETQFSQGRNSAALSEYRVAAGLDHRLAPIHLRIAKVLLLQGDREGAIAACRKAVELNPGLGEAHIMWAEALQELGRKEEAAAQLERALGLDRGSAVTQGRRLQVLGRFDEARRAFERELASNPASVWAYQGIVSGRRVTEEDRELVRRMQSLAADPRLSPRDRPVLHFSLGKAFDDLGEFESAMRHYSEANQSAARNTRLGFDANFLRSFNDARMSAFGRESIARLRKWGSPSTRPLLVVGMIRSGTTLVEQMLSSHPQVSAAGELRFWAEQEDSFMAALTQGALDAERVQGIADQYEQLLSNVSKADSSSVERVIDKMPLNFSFLGMIHSVFPNARIIHCTRNPVANCLSIYTTFFDSPPPFAYEPKNIVAYYREYRRLMAHWREVLPAESFLEVRYEDVVADREPQLRRMIAFAGLEWDEGVLQHDKNERAVRTPSMWQVRQPIYTSAVERWKNYQPWLGEFAELLEEEV